MPSKDSIEILHELSKIRHLRIYRLILCVPIGIMLITYTLLVLGANFFPTTFGPVIHSFLFQTLAFLFVPAIALLSFPAWLLTVFIASKKCPRCDNAFHAKIAFHWAVVGSSYTRKCLHCGLLLNGSNVEGSSNYALKGTSV